jgi:hypothetical protein
MRQDSVTFTVSLNWLTPWNSVLQKLPSASKEILCLYGIRMFIIVSIKSQPRIPILRQMNLIHTIQNYFSMIHFINYFIYL